MTLEMILFFEDQSCDHIKLEDTGSEIKCFKDGAQVMPGEIHKVSMDSYVLDAALRSLVEIDGVTKARKEQEVEELFDYIKENATLLAWADLDEDVRDPYLLSVLEERFGDDMDTKRLAAFILHHDIEIDNLDEVSVESDNYLSYGGRDYDILDDFEADDRMDQYCNDMAEEMFHNLEEWQKQFIDVEKFTEVTKSDGRGHSLSSYDGEEVEIDFQGETFYMYAQ